MSPNSRRQADTIAALKRACTLAVLIAIGFTFGMAQAEAVNPDRPIRPDGTMSNPGPYEIVVNVRRSGEHKTATARFQYWYQRQ